MTRAALYCRLSRIFKVNGNQASHSACHLIQKSRCLVPVMILRIFSHMGISNRIHLPVIKERV